MKKRAIVVSVFFWQSSVFAMSLQDYLKTVESKNKAAQSYEVSKEAIESRRIAEDIDLAPALTAGYNYELDKSPLGQFVVLGATETETTTYSLGLSKKFSTGTTLGLAAATTEIENQGLTAPQFAQFSKAGTGSLGVSLQQSLWKDFFGRATRLRWERLEATTEAQKLNFDLQKKLFLVNAEAAFWDYIYALDSLQIGRESLQRAQKIENWTRRRVNDGIGERADLLQAQALVASRQLNLISVEDDLASAKRKIRDFLELSDADAFPDIKGDPAKSRPLNSMIEGTKGKVVTIDAYLASLSAKAQSVVAKETEDAFRPDLVLTASYNTNSLESDMAGATAQLGDTSRPTTKVGLNFVYLFDVAAKSSAKNAARKEALAAQLVSERKMMDSESSWIELNRRYIEMSKRIDSASKISSLQMKSAQAQSDLFNKGRSITKNVIDAEEDAANAALNLTRLRTEQRKMEAQGRLFVAVEE